MKNHQELKISTDSTDSLCTTNPRNRRKLRKLCITTRLLAGLLFNRVETSSQSTKQWKIESGQLVS